MRKVLGEKSQGKVACEGGHEIRRDFRSCRPEAAKPQPEYRRAQQSADVEPRLLLVHFLRETLGLTGTHVGCDTSNCGACTVHLNGEAVKSCTLLAVQADGAEVKTIEGMGQEGALHPLQEAFREHHGLQCGFCTPGMITRAFRLLQENPDPTESEIRLGISGNLCRCTG